MPPAVSGWSRARSPLISLSSCALHTDRYLLSASFFRKYGTRHGNYLFQRLSPWRTRNTVRVTGGLLLVKALRSWMQKFGYLLPQLWA